MWPSPVRLVLLNACLPKKTEQLSFTMVQALPWSLPSGCAQVSALVWASQDEMIETKTLCSRFINIILSNLGSVFICQWLVNQALSNKICLWSRSVCVCVCVCVCVISRPPTQHHSTLGCNQPTQSTLTPWPLPHHSPFGLKSSVWTFPEPLDVLVTNKY